MSVPSLSLPDYASMITRTSVLSDDAIRALRHDLADLDPASDEEEATIDAARDHLLDVLHERKRFAEALHTVRCRAIVAACKRMTVFPVVDGAMALTTRVSYCFPPGVTGPGESDWSPEPVGDPTGRMLVEVLTGDGRTVDSFYATEGEKEVRPCGGNRNELWWTEPVPVRVAARVGG